ncbi:unnamed protein product [Closterium sp. NIES-64]|nr:unnamed protein product [Closterium sp. NIES-64]
MRGSKRADADLARRAETTGGRVFRSPEERGRRRNERGRWLAFGEQSRGQGGSGGGSVARGENSPHNAVREETPEQGVEDKEEGSERSWAARDEPSSVAGAKFTRQGKGGAVPLGGEGAAPRGRACGRVPAARRAPGAGRVERRRFAFGRTAAAARGRGGERRKQRRRSGTVSSKGDAAAPYARQARPD